ncbi:MAG: PilN domain-containing protein [Patescibacteria group bacterium]
MININLLSPEQKKSLKTKRVYIATKEMVMLVLLFTTIIAIMLLVSRYVLETQLANLVIRNANAIKISQETNKKIINLNKVISEVETIQRNFKLWSGFLIRLTRTVPENISFSTLKIYRDSATLEIKGKAKARPDLIKFQKNLEDSKLFKNVNLPLADLLVKENNNFTIQAVIDLEKIP